MIDGIYIAYFNAEFGTSLGMFVLKDGKIVGADIGGTKYQGELSISNDEVTAFGKINVSMDKPGMTITGSNNELPVSYDTNVEFCLPIEDQPYHRVDTATGPVNIRFEKVQET